MRFKKITEIKKSAQKTLGRCRTAARRIHSSSLTVFETCKEKAMPVLRSCGRSTKTAYVTCKTAATPVLRTCGRGMKVAYVTCKTATTPVLHTCCKGIDTTLCVFETGVKAVLTPLHNHKKITITALSLCALLIISVSASFSSHTFYEYSVGGQVLGVVKDEKMVSRAVENSSVKVIRTENPAAADKASVAGEPTVQNDSIVAIPAQDGTSVVIDKDEDIVVQKKVVANLSEVTVDKGEDIIEKITTLENVDVVAYMLNIDDRTFGPFETRDAAQSILDRVKDYRLGDQTPENHRDKYKEVGFDNEVAINETSAPKEQIADPDGVYDEIMKGVLEYKEYKVKDGDNIFDIAIDNDITIEKIEELNPTANLEVIHTGDKLRLEEEKTILRVKTVEEIEYDETFTADPVYNDTDKLYEGEEIVLSKGSKGERHVTADLVKLNGKKSEVQVTATEVLRESVPDKIMRGTKKLPPSIGKGYFIMPANAGITSGFKYRWGRHHNGIDIGVRYGSVYAADGGEVIFAGNRGDGYGNKIIINHGGGRQTLYAHLSEIDVKVGEKVYQGRRIATSGNTGASTGPHLHFEVHINGVPKNPMDYL